MTETVAWLAHCFRGEPYERPAVRAYLTGAQGCRRVVLDGWPGSTAGRRLPFGSGHRIRLEVSSSNFPKYDRNLNHGGSLLRSGAEEAVMATQSIFLGESCLTLPVVARAGRRSAESHGSASAVGKVHRNRRSRRTAHSPRTV